MDANSTGADNRKFQRIPFKRGVWCKVRESEPYVGEVAQDLSVGGVRIRSNTFVPVGEKVALGIQFKDSGEVIEMVGRVVWVRFNPYSENYQLGVQFDQERSAFPLSRIHRFISSS